jgi:pimeloyl-ACP methyl ester carboxylesterase
MSRPILLVHGAFHSGECWSLFEPHLKARGFEVHVLTLGGHRGNPRPAGEVSMQSYGDDVIARAEQIGRPCMLLGHSMGGMVVSTAAERRPELFSSVVYLAAFAPPYGEHSTMDLPPTSPEMMASPPQMAEGGGAVVYSEEAARRVFYNRCTPELQDFAVARLSPQPIGGGMGRIQTSEAGLGSVPKHYIECTDDAALPITSQRTMQSHMSFGSIQTLDADHSPFLSAPAELADAILKIAEMEQA